MLKPLFGLLVVVAGIASAEASDRAAVVSTLHKWVDSFNKNDGKSFSANCTDETSIVDVFPPYEWHGSGACTKWFNDAQAFEKTSGVMSSSLAVGKPKHLTVSGDVAYLAAPATFKATLKTKQVSEPSVFAMSFKKTGDEWRVTGWGWVNQ